MSIKSACTHHTHTHTHMKWELFSPFTLYVPRKGNKASNLTLDGMVPASQPTQYNSQSMATPGTWQSRQFRVPMWHNEYHRITQHFSIASKAWDLALSFVSCVHVNHGTMSTLKSNCWVFSSATCRVWLIWPTSCVYQDHNCGVVQHLNCRCKCHCLLEPKQRPTWAIQESNLLFVDLWLTKIPQKPLQVPNQLVTSLTWSKPKLESIHQFPTLKEVCPDSVDPVTNHHKVDSQPIETIYKTRPEEQKIAHL